MSDRNLSAPAFEARCLDSLAKVFPDEPWPEGAHAASGGTALANETYAFQVAFRAPALIKRIRVRMGADPALAALTTVRSVGLVPSELPCHAHPDDQVLRTTPGLYPDPLVPVGSDGVTAVPHQWRAVWVTVKLDGTVPPGMYPLTISFVRVAASGAGREDMLGEASFRLTVLSAALPEQTLLHTEWFHTDCLATYYGCEVFSERHWQLIDAYMQTAVEHGINMLLTPLFTPPLDTAVGGERPTVQLIDVERTGEDTYRFGFDRLQRWVRLARSRGVRYFEMSHLFTQWGARHAPKVMAKTGPDETRRIFGWDTDAGGPEYRRFLEAFLPALTGFLEAEGIAGQCWFHVSDEPRLADLESYRSASGIVRNSIPDYPVFDALSDFDFYRHGLVRQPVPASNHIEPFLEHGVPGLWTYYCNGQHIGCSNRFFNMPSARTRILGMQLYKFDIAGFLHWGYNFWYTQYSVKAIDPYRVTDAGLAFPSGDSFVVYPGEDGPVESMRLESMLEALQDLRALRLLESHIGRERTMALLEEGLETPLAFGTYATDAVWLLRARKRINAAIADAVANI